MRCRLSAASAERKPPPQYKNQLLVLVGRLVDDVALDHAAAEVLGAARVAGAPLVVLARVDEPELVAALLPGEHVVDGALDDARLGVVDERFELFRMGHDGVIFPRWPP